MKLPLFCGFAGLAVALAMPAAVAAQAGSEALASGKPYQLPGATTDIVTAPSGEQYRFFIHIPDSPPPPQGFPLLYVLDGDDNFPIAVATARRLARAAPRSGVGPGIIVGIDSGDLKRRARDYTPHFDRPATREGQPGHGLPTGGADAFLDFVSGTLQPRLTKDFPVDPARISITGHSFGGLLVLHAALTRPSLFHSVTAASPSLWLADEAMMRKVKAMPQRHVASSMPAIILTVGEQENAQALEDFAAALSAKGYKVRTRTLSGEDHGSTMPTTLTEAVRAAF